VTAAPIINNPNNLNDLLFLHSSPTVSDQATPSSSTPHYCPQCGVIATNRCSSCLYNHCAACVAYVSVIDVRDGSSRVLLLCHTCNTPGNFFSPPPQ
jgi:hypothetical protein